MTSPRRSLTEEFLLLVLDDTTGKPVTDSTKLHVCIAASAVTELVLDGHIVIAEQDTVDATGTKVKAGRFIRTTTAPPADPLMQEILDKAVGAKPKDAVSLVGGASAWRNRAGSLKDELLLRMAQEGLLREEQAKILGLFNTTRWTAGDPSVETALRERVLAALRTRSAADEPTAALIALLWASKLLPKVFPTEDKKAIEAAGQVVSADGFTPEAVKKAIEEIQAVMMTAVVVPVIVSSGSS